MVIVLSDGDNLDLPYSTYGSFGQDHTTPLGWSLSPLLNEFAPIMFEHYSSHLAQGDAFVAAPSGGGFCYPSVNPHLPAFIEHTERTMRENRLRFLWLLDHPVRGYPKKLLGKVARFTTGIFMEYVILRPYHRSMEMYDGTPAVFSSGFVERDGRIAERIIARTPRKKPAFLFVGVEMRYNTPEHIDAEVSKLDPEEYEVVSVPRFFELVKCVMSGP